MNRICPICEDPLIEQMSFFGCPTCNLGFDPTSADGIYGDEYLVHYLLYETTKFSNELMQARFNFVQEYASIGRETTLLDYGCGAGTFGSFVELNSFVRTYSHDPFLHVDHSFIKYLKGGHKFNVVTFWDSFEHIRRLEIVPLLRGQHVFLTLPIIENRNQLERWKHYVPGEHVWYFSTDALIALFEKWNYKLIAQSDFEERLRSPGIKSFCFKHGG